MDKYPTVNPLIAPAKQAKTEKPIKLNQNPSKKLSLFFSSEFKEIISVSE